MLNKKTKLKLTDFERNLLINGMNEFRNMILSDGIPTEDVDELLLKIINKSEREGVILWQTLLKIFITETSSRRSVPPT